MLIKAGACNLRHFLLCSLSVVAIAAPAAAQEADAKWQPYVQLLAKPGTERSLGRLSFFVPVWQDGTSLAFGDLRLGLDGDDQQELNLGAGYRTLRDEWILGAHAYYDLVRTDSENTLGALTLGAEAISADWDVTANGYVGLGGLENTNVAGARLIGSNIYVETNQERALHGVDLTVGRRFAFGPEADVRAYGGGFAFFANDVDAVTGGRMGVQYTRHDLFGRADLTVGAELQADNYRHTQAFGEVAIRIPLGKAPERRATALEARMVDPVVRDIDVVVRGTKAPRRDIAINPLTGQAIGGVQIVDSTVSLESAVANGAENTIFLVSGDHSLGSSLVLKPGHKLIGGNADLRVAAPDGTVVTVTGVESTAGSVTFADGTQPTLVMGSGTELNGIDVTGGRNNVLIQGNSNFVISSATLSGATETAILFERGASATAATSEQGSIDLRDLTLSGMAASNGLVVENFDGSVTLDNVAIDGFGGTTGAVWIHDSNVDLSIKNSRFTNNAENVVIINGTLGANGYDGETKALTALVENSTFESGTGSASGIWIGNVKGKDGVADDIVIRDNRFTNNPGGDFVATVAGDAGVVIADNVFTNATGDSAKTSRVLSVLAAKGAAVSATLSGNQITGGGAGIGLTAYDGATLTTTVSGGFVRDVSRVSSVEYDHASGLRFWAVDGGTINATVTDLEVDGIRDNGIAFGIWAYADVGGTIDLTASNLTIADIQSTAGSARGILLEGDGDPVTRGGGTVTATLTDIAIAGVDARTFATGFNLYADNGGSVTAAATNLSVDSSSGRVARGIVVEAIDADIAADITNLTIRDVTAISAVSAENTFADGIAVWADMADVSVTVSGATITDLVGEAAVGLYHDAVDSTLDLSYTNLAVETAHATEWDATGFWVEGSGSDVSTTLSDVSVTDLKADVEDARGYVFDLADGDLNLSASDISATNFDAVYDAVGLSVENYGTGATTDLALDGITVADLAVSFYYGRAYGVELDVGGTGSTATLTGSGWSISGLSSEGEAVGVNSYNGSGTTLQFTLSDIAVSNFSAGWAQGLSLATHDVATISLSGLSVSEIQAKYIGFGLYVGGSADTNLTLTGSVDGVHSQAANPHDHFNDYHAVGLVIDPNAGIVYGRDIGGLTIGNVTADAGQSADIVDLGN